MMPVSERLEAESGNWKILIEPAAAGIPVHLL
jgi:hypothetical protein